MLHDSIALDVADRVLNRSSIPAMPVVVSDLSGHESVTLWLLERTNEAKRSIVGVDLVCKPELVCTKLRTMPEHHT